LRHDALLRQQRWFAGLGSDQQALLLSTLVERRFTRGQVIQAEDTQGAGLYWLVEGTIRALRQVDDHGPALIHVGQPGFWFGQAAVLEQGRLWVTIVARTAVTALLLTRADYQRLAPQLPGLSDALYSLVHRRSFFMLKFVAETRTLPPDTLIRLRLADLADVRRGEMGGAAGPVVLALTQAEVGELVGMARQQANTRLRTLAAQGLVRLGHGSVMIPDAEALRASASRIP
jgi:CRP-like cAMP-binding protein